MIVRRWHRSILEVRLFRGAECDTDHCLVVAKVRENLALSNQETQKFDVERFNLRKISVLEISKQVRLRSKTGLQLWRT